MHRIRALMIGGLALALIAGTAPASAAQDFNLNRTTYVTIDGPMALPGLTLPAGTYTFELVEMAGNRNVIKVTSEDGSKQYGAFMTVSASRLDPSAETVITFSERAENMPPALRYWYYPGLQIGHEFVYPRPQALQIARVSGEDVLASDADARTGELRTAEVSRVTPTGEERPIENEASAETRVASRESMTQAAEQGAIGTAGQAEALPKTASPLPLIGLLGLLSLAGGLGVRYVARS